jgi:aminoglycoside phosphotransferase (APT) family kinase protein
MTTLEKPTSQIAERLLQYLRTELNNPEIEYGESITRLEGGFDTFIFKFQLSGIQKELSAPLVLRLFPEYREPEAAVGESELQNELAISGFPVPRVHFTCADKTILGGAFFIMDFVEGEDMLTAAAESFPEKLGELHASLHQIDVKPLLEEKGISEQEIQEMGLDGTFHWLNETAQNDYTWLGEVVAWLLKNRSPEPKRLSICHGDFHPMNILMKDGKVAGVIDWSGFKIADQVSDLANSINLVAIHGEQLLLLPQPEIVNIIERYVGSYLKQNPVSIEYVPYYRVLSCVISLLSGAAGQEQLRLPYAVKGATEYIHDITGIQITPPF